MSSTQQVHPVGDGADYPYAEQRGVGSASAAEQAGATDDDGGDRVEEYVTSAAGLADREKPRALVWNAWGHSACGRPGVTALTTTEARSALRTRPLAFLVSMRCDP
jgi:hypothetical protein